MISVNVCLLKRVSYEKFYAIALFARDIVDDCLQVRSPKIPCFMLFPELHIQSVSENFKLWTPLSNQKKLPTQLHIYQHI